MDNGRCLEMITWTRPLNTSQEKWLFLVSYGFTLWKFDFIIQSAEKGTIVPIANTKLLTLSWWKFGALFFSAVAGRHHIVALIKKFNYPFFFLQKKSSALLLPVFYTRCVFSSNMVRLLSNEIISRLLNNHLNIQSKNELPLSFIGCIFFSLSSTSFVAKERREEKSSWLDLNRKITNVDAVHATKLQALRSMRLVICQLWSGMKLKWGTYTYRPRKQLKWFLSFPDQHFH